VFSFFYFGTIIVLASVLVVALRNPVYSVIALLIMFFHMAGLFITLHAEFLAAVQIIVYAGAILVLYLFVVMLLNLKRDESYQRQLWLGVGLGGVALAEVIYLVISAHPTVSLPLQGEQLPTSAQTTGVVAQGNTELIGALLYTKYLFPFELASLILLVAMIGAILLAKKGILEAKGDS
jgi:NADH-quinone oxidoreductase subunit J